jgi:hypothetical protein
MSCSRITPNCQRLSKGKTVDAEALARFSLYFVFTPAVLVVEGNIPRFKLFIRQVLHAEHCTCFMQDSKFENLSIPSTCTI